MNLLYVKIGACIILLLGAFASGWHIRDVDFAQFKEQVAVIAKAQEEKVKSIRSQQELVTKGIENEYEAKLSAIRNYYKSNSVWNNASGGTMPTLSNTPSATDVITAYNELTGRCAETTLMLVELQKWLNEQVGIK